MYVFVETESISKAIDSTSHPTETGLPITSTIQKQPIELSISGRIVKNDKYDANTTEKKLEELQNAGSLITYKGLNNLSNLQIQSFNSDHDNKTWGGMTFSMTLRQVRIAKSSYQPKSSTNEAQKNASKEKPKLEAGAIVVFTGGPVYVSSDATRAAANRGRSTCKIHIPNSNSNPVRTESWAKHPIHLVSTDGGKVYGWVDKANIEGVPSSSTGNKENGGTQQVNAQKKADLMHKVKKGDTVYALSKKYGVSGNTIISNNPDAFGTVGNPTTLKVGAKMLIIKE